MSKRKASDNDLFKNKKQLREIVESPYADELKSEALKYTHVKYTEEESMINLYQKARFMLRSIDFPDKDMFTMKERFADREKIVEFIYLLFVVKVAIIENNIDVRDYVTRIIKTNLTM